MRLFLDVAVRIVYTAPWPHCPNKKVFSDRRIRLYGKSASLRCDGKLFHRLGPAAAKALSPVSQKVLVHRLKNASGRILTSCHIYPFFSKDTHFAVSGKVAFGTPGSNFFICLLVSTPIVICHMYNSNTHTHTHILYVGSPSLRRLTVIGLSYLCILPDWK